MAKKSAIQKNLNKEKQVKKNKSRRDRLKAICNNRSIPMEQRFEILDQKSYLNGDDGFSMKPSNWKIIWSRIIIP